MDQGKRWLTMVVCFTLLVSGVMIAGTPTFAKAKNLAPLSSVPVPLPPNLGDFVVDQQAAIQLGKALFWDQQVGGDGTQACASCHFQAGADIRSTNCVNPGADHIFQTCPPGSTVTAAKFPIKTDDIVASQGVTDGNFLKLNLGSPFDFFQSLINALFGTNRLVTGRNAPSAVNAIYYYRNFWDGRANNTFNGVDPFGPTNQESAFVYQVVNGKATWVKIAVKNASLASQACGPPNNPVEMAYAGRSFQLLGRKMLKLKPLAEQVVDPTDSVLGPLAAATGLNTTYADMIKAAFHPKWWNYNGVVAGGFNMREANFSLYFGLAVMLYESTLVSDQTPLDKFLEGDTRALTANQKVGMKVYTGKGKCAQCHGGAELSEAAVSQVGGNPKKGFTNTGVRPLAEDGGDILQPGQAKFKAPALRNVELNGPYFHNGGYATLRQTVDFYNRGGDFPNKFTDSDVRPLGLTVAEKKALVDFMLAMTDERVRYERAPFDHPAMTLPNGTALPAVGAAGSGTPLNTFLNLNPHQP